MVYSAAQTVRCGRDEAELARRAEATGQQLAGLRQSGLAGSPAEIVDKLGRFADAGASRAYLQVLDLHDLGHLELIAAEVVPGSADPRAVCSRRAAGVLWRGRGFRDGVAPLGRADLGQADEVYELAEAGQAAERGGWGAAEIP